MQIDRGLFFFFPHFFHGRHIMRLCLKSIQAVKKGHMPVLSSCSPQSSCQTHLPKLPGQTNDVLSSERSLYVSSP